MSTIRCLLILLCVMTIRGDDIERTARQGIMIKLLREMVNQTHADTLNLPANATSIRENITDTFSCENRTYGYYADVDNECQIFHVCLTSRSASGRNTTYRWSFICPNETIFNQEVLTCTRPRDAIDCEESPMYYYMNNDIGKIPNNTKENFGNETRRKPLMKRNLVMNDILTEVKREIQKDVDMVDFETIDDGDIDLMPIIEEEVVYNGKDDDDVSIDKDMENDKVFHDVNEEYAVKDRKDSRMGKERSLKNFGRISRGSFRFKADV